MNFVSPAKPSSRFRSPLMWAFVILGTEMLVFAFLLALDLIQATAQTSATATLLGRF